MDLPLMYILVATLDHNGNNNIIAGLHARIEDFIAGTVDDPRYQGENARVSSMALQVSQQS